MLRGRLMITFRAKKVAKGPQQPVSTGNVLGCHNLNRDHVMQFNFRFNLACSLLWTLSSCLAMASDWNQFRGPGGTGLGEQLKSAPLSLEQVTWKSEIGTGTSSLAHHGDRIFTTAYEGDKRFVVCLSAVDGKQLWREELVSARKETATPPNGPATCTPVCDAHRVIVLFPDVGLLAYNHDGKQLWKNDLGPFYSMHGISASPLLVNDKIIVVADQLQNPFIACLSASDGKEIWRSERLLGVTGGYSTPTVLTRDGQQFVLSAAPGELVAYNLQTGEKEFSLLGLTNAPVSLAVLDQDHLYYSEPPGEPIPMEALGDADKNKDGVIELGEVKNSVGTYRLIERIDNGFGNGDGQVDKAEWDKGFGSFLNKGGLSCVQLTWDEGKLNGTVKWKYTKTTPYIPSALVVGGIVYVINDGGILMGFDAQTGDLIKRDRMRDATGQYYASPIAAGDRIILASLQGKLTVVQSGKEFSVLGTTDLGESIVATPSIQDGKLFVRTRKQIFCFGPASS